MLNFKLLCRYTLLFKAILIFRGVIGLRKFLVIIIFGLILSGTWIIVSDFNFFNLLVLYSESEEISEENLAKLYDLEYKLQNTFKTYDKDNDEFINSFGIVPNGMSVLYQDDFLDVSLDSNIWNIVYQTIVPKGELQIYSEKNISINNGELILSAFKEDDNYISAMVDTESKLSLTYGRVDIKMRLIDGKGFFPAVWLLYNDEKNVDYTYVEVDIMESLGENPNLIYGVYHLKDEDGLMVSNNGEVRIENPLNYHTYSVDIKPDGIKYSVDGKVFYYYKADIPEVPLYLIINLAIGGTWFDSPDDDTVFPNNIAIDKIRVLTYE